MKSSLGRVIVVSVFLATSLLVSAPASATHTSSTPPTSPANCQLNTQNAHGSGTNGFKKNVNFKASVRCSWDVRASVLVWGDVRSGYYGGWSQFAQKLRKTRFDDKVVHNSARICNIGTWSYRTRATGYSVESGTTYSLSGVGVSRSLTRVSNQNNGWCR